MLIIGIDPDSKKIAISVYQNGKLEELLMLDTIQLYKTLDKYQCDNHEIIVYLENVKANSSSSFHNKSKDSLAVKSKKSEHIGMVKQSQSEIERVCDHLGIVYHLKKISSNWKKGNGVESFKLATGWTKRSNEDTRSAAYFGFLGVRENYNILRKVK